MFSWVKKKLTKFKKHKKVSGQIDPQAFQSLAVELQELARIAERLWPEEEQFRQRIKRIKDEMSQLDALISKPEFRRLSTEKRMELRRSLLQSKAQLLETMHKAPSPTSLKQ